MKEDKSRALWYSSEAETELRIHERIYRSKLLSVDGATMKSYQIPPKAFETVFCQCSPKIVWRQLEDFSFLLARSEAS